MKSRLQDDLKAAMKAGDRIRTMTIRGVLAEITRHEKDVRREASEADVVAIVKRERARREEALEFARKGNRADLIEQNQAEAVVLESYLPAAISAEEIQVAIAKQIQAGVISMGPIMKSLKEQFGPRIDGKLASDLVKQALTQK